MGFISPIPTDTRGNEIQTGSTQSLGRNDFLQLLVTKLQNQDPLKPMDDEDFIAQLAQFSSLEQMNNIAEGIDASNQWDFMQMQSINNTMAAGLIGKEVMAAYNGVFYDGDKAPEINFTTDRYADEIDFIVRNELGEVVARLNMEDVPPGANSLTWDGRDTLGNRVPEGYYTIEASGTAPGGALFEPKLSLVGLVESISYRGGGAYLRVNGTDIALGDVSAVGAPGSFSDDSPETDDPQ